MFCIVILIGITAAIGGVSIVAGTLGIVYCRGHKKGMHKAKLMDYTLALYRGLVKVHPLTKEHPPPTFGLFFCIRLKFT